MPLVFAIQAGHKMGTEEEDFRTHNQSRGETREKITQPAAHYVDVLVGTARKEKFTRGGKKSSINEREV